MRPPLLQRLSFQAKLLLSFAVVVTLATAIGYLFINRSVSRAFSDFTVRSFTRQDQIMASLLVVAYQRTGSFEEMAAVLEAGEHEVPLLLADPDGRIRFAGDDALIGRQLTGGELGRGIPVTLADGETWTVVPYRTMPGQDALQEGFLDATRRSLWLAALAAGAAALLFSLMLLRQIAKPVKRFDLAARRIAEGHLNERVEVMSSDEIGRLGTSINEMAASLQQAEETKKRMIADISHELRTPLTAVRTALEGLRDGLIEPTQQTFASLHNRLLLFTRLVNDLHQLALADAGRLSIEATTCHAGPILRGIADTIDAQLEDEGIELRVDVPDGLPPMAADPHRLEQVLLNLLANAIRHTPEGGTIEISARKAPDGGIETRVCDTGPGLTPNERQQVFERFYRTDSARAGDAGAGLGLPIARALVEAQKGRITVESGPGGGACFAVWLPQA